MPGWAERTFAPCAPPAHKSGERFDEGAIDLSFEFRHGTVRAGSYPFFGPINRTKEVCCFTSCYKDNCQLTEVAAFNVPVNRAKIRSLIHPV